MVFKGTEVDEGLPGLPGQTEINSRLKIVKLSFKSSYDDHRIDNDKALRFLAHLKSCQRGD